jgi:hypothetical protein
LVCIVDDLESPQPARFQWLLHAAEQFRLDEDGQTLISHRGDAQMDVHLISPGGFTFSQTNEWPLDPKTGFPTAKKREPTRLWHFTAETRQQAAKRRIAAVMNVAISGELPDCDVQASDAGMLRVKTKREGSEVMVEIDLSTDRPGDKPLLEVRCKPDDGDAETLTIPK